MPLTSHYQNKAIIGEATIPGDKSVSHRAIILSSIAKGETAIAGLLEAEDTMATINAFRQMRVQITKNEGTNQWHVHGVGLNGLKTPEEPLDMGNSGTSARLISGVIAGAGVHATLTGDASLSRRPMARIIEPLSQMGVEIKASKNNTLPMTINRSIGLKNISYKTKVASAQIKSCILLAGLYADGKTEVIEPQLSRPHTERMLRFFGKECLQEEMSDGRVKVSLGGEGALISPEETLQVPADPSSAAFFVAAALLIPGSKLTCKNILMDETRCGFYAALKLMGAKLEFLNQRQLNGEHVADIQAEYTPALKGVEIPSNLIPSMIDECPIFMVVAAFATGATKLKALEELKVKESDRLGTMAEGLQACGVSFDLGESEIAIHGSGHEKARNTYGTETRIKTQHDHRIAMSFLVMGSACEKGTVIECGEAIKTSFPNFVSLMNELGCSIKAA